MQDHEFDAEEVDRLRGSGNGEAMTPNNEPSTTAAHGLGQCFLDERDPCEEEGK